MLNSEKKTRVFILLIIVALGAGNVGAVSVATKISPLSGAALGVVVVCLWTLFLVQVVKNKLAPVR